MSESQPGPSPQRIMDMGWGFGPPLLLVEAAVRNGLFDALEQGPRTAAEAAGASGTSERGARICMDALVGLGFLDRGGERYSLTDESRAFLIRSSPEFRGGFLRFASTQILPGWLQLAEVLRTGRPAIARTHDGDGEDLFPDFVEGLFPLSYEAARALAAALAVAKSSRTFSVLDVAAGSGVWSIALAEASSHVRVTAVDRSGVLPVTRRMAERHGVADRYRFVAGDVRDFAFGSGYDVAILGHILHAEGSARSATLLRRVHDALRPGGTVVIADWIRGESRAEPINSVLFAVNMLIHTEEGDTLTLSEISGWLCDAGFVDVRTVAAPTPWPLVLASRA